MKLGLFTVLFGRLPFEEMLDKVVGFKIEAVEIGTGNYPGDAHAKPDELLNDPQKLKHFKDAIESRGLVISGLSCHGNPLHPQEEVARKFHDTWRKTVLLAEKLGVDVINLFSGCPGDSDGSKYPNWVVCPWPTDFQEILKWQWEEKVIPYWQAEAKFAADHGVTRLAFEMHPGFVVYNPETLLKLRAAVGPSIGANFDPSHLFWQGIDPVKAIRALGKEKAIYHFHAKDTYLDPVNIPVNGVLDTKSYANIEERAWIFRSVGYGMGEKVWRDIVSALHTVGYDHVLSIEHEDKLASIEEGLGKAVSLLREVILKEEPAQPWWI